ADRMAEQRERFDQHALMESATSQSGRPRSSKGARTFRATFRETPRQVANGVTEARQLPPRSTARSKGQICATDVADKNKPAADDGPSRQNALRIRARQLLGKNRK